MVQGQKHRISKNTVCIIGIRPIRIQNMSNRLKCGSVHDVVDDLAAQMAGQSSILGVHFELGDIEPIAGIRQVVMLSLQQVVM